MGCLNGVHTAQKDRSDVGEPNLRGVAKTESLAIKINVLVILRLPSRS